MVRHKRLVARLGLLGILVVLAFPGAGSALVEPFVVTLTGSGPSPTSLSMPVGFPLWFENSDTASHSVAFANGTCSIQVAPGSHGTCPGHFPIGTYDYTVDGSTQAQVVVTAIPRSVSLKARRTRITRGDTLLLHGPLNDIQFPYPGSAGSPQPILVLAMHYHGHRLHRISVVHAKVHRDAHGTGSLRWRLRVRPTTSMTYIAEAVYQPKSGRVWAHAWSKPLRVAVENRLAG